MNDMPGGIHHFLRDHIDSVEQLEVLALLQTEPVRRWSVAEISHELRSTDVSVGKRLAGLVQSGVVTEPDPGAYLFNPNDPALAALTREVVAYYRLRPYRVMDVLFSKPQSAIKTFADSFRLKKDES